jgi:AAA domain
MKEAPDINDTLRDEGVDGVRRRNDKARRYKPDAKANGADDNLDKEIKNRPGRFVLYREVALRARRSKNWLVKGLLGAGEASAFFGAPGDGKSVLVEDLGLHVAAGLPWHGREVMKGHVLYFALERRPLVERRLLAFQFEHDIADAPFTICPPGFLDFRDSHVCERIIDVIKAAEDATSDKVVLIVIDTLSRALAGADENSSKDMGAVVRATSILQEDGARHVLWVHHTPHGAERLRGHGNLEGALDTAIHVTHDQSSNIRRAVVTKANDSEEGEQVAFTLKSVTINPEDGTTAPVVVPVEDAPKMSKPSKASKSFAALRAIILDLATETRTPYADDPSMKVKAAKVSEVRNEHYRQHVSRDGSTDPKKVQGAKQRSFHRDMTGARKAGLIMVRDDYVWLTK